MMIVIIIAMVIIIVIDEPSLTLQGRSSPGQGEAIEFLDPGFLPREFSLFAWTRIWDSNPRLPASESCSFLVVPRVHLHQHTRAARARKSANMVCMALKFPAWSLRMPAAASEMRPRV